MMREERRESDSLEIENRVNREKKTSDKIQRQLRIVGAPKLKMMMRHPTKGESFFILEEKYIGEQLNWPCLNTGL